MRLAIFSDVHGNFAALEAVFADIKRQGSFDHLVFVGDLAYGAHEPRHCAELLQSHDVLSVYGNTDEWFWAEPQRDEQLSEADWQLFLKNLEWHKDAIGEAGLHYLQKMPFELRFSPDSSPAHDLLVVHANPANVLDVIMPSESYEAAMPSYLKIFRSDAELELMLEGIIPRTIAYGHLHVPNVRKAGNYSLMNISSISQPRDGDWRAKYAILTFEKGEWQAEHRYVEYNLPAMIRALLASGMPTAAAQAGRFPPVS